MELQELLAWLVSGGGAGIIAYWLIGVIPALEGLVSEAKRYVAFALTGVLAVGAWYVTILLQYTPQPETTKAWIEAVFSVIAVALGVNQIIHARRVLSKR